MQAAILMLIGGTALAAMSAKATPLTPKPLGPIIYMPNQELAQLPNDPPSLAPLVPCRLSNW
jgi:hypothetical protein